MRWSDSPIVSFIQDGATLTLGRGPEDARLLHLYGSQGLGLPPVSIAKSDRLGGDGSIVRGVRYGDREVFIPLLIEGLNVGHLDELRADLYARLAPHLGPVTVRVESPTMATVREITGYLKDGLTGDFGSGFHGTWQTLGLTFECPDPWWMGEQRLTELRVAPGTKPFISTSVPFFPVVLSGSTVQGAFDVEITGDAQVRPVWQVEGPGSDLVITVGSRRIAMSGEIKAGEIVTFDARTGAITPDRWSSVSLDTDADLLRLNPGRQRVEVTMVGATTASVVRLVYRERFAAAI